MSIIKIKIHKACLPAKRGFTLIELLIVIAIIGILASIVMVSLSSAKTKALRASALSSVKSVMGELTTCADDGGEATASAPATTFPICCDDDGSVCGGFLSGHDIFWPDIAATGWTYTVPSGSLGGEDYHYEISNPTTGEANIVCDFSNKSCQ